MIKIKTKNSIASNEKLSSILINKFGENSIFTITSGLNDSFIVVTSDDLKIIEFLKTYCD